MIARFFFWFYQKKFYSKERLFRFFAFFRPLFRQAKCKALRDEMDGLRWAREEESRANRERGEAQKAALTRQLREREDELEAQRADSAEAFDRIMQQRQEETQARWARV